MNESLRYQLLTLLEANPDITQRQLAEELGISLGKANYCLRALMDKGWVKVRKFKENPNKKAYAYLLTPKGIEEKARVGIRFLKRKIQEYDALVREIEELRQEVAEMNPEEEGLQ